MNSLSAFRYVGDVRSFLTWWREELSACVPERVKALSSRLGQSEIRLGRDRVEIDRIEGEIGRTFTDDRALEAQDQEGWEQLGALLLGTRTRLFLEPRDFWHTRLSLPARARSNLRSAIALQLHLIAPLHPDLLEWTWRVERRDKTHIHLVVAMARRSRLDRIVELFEAQDLASPPLCCMTELGPLQLRGGVAIHRSPASRQERQMAAVAALLVAMIPLLTLFGTYLLTFTNETKLTQLRAQVSPKLVAEQRARQTINLRRALAPMAQRLPVSTVLGELSAIVPDNSYVQHLTYDANGGIEFILVGELDKTAQETVGKGTRRLAVSQTSPPAQAESVAQSGFRASLR